MTALSQSERDRLWNERQRKIDRNLKTIGRLLILIGICCAAIIVVNVGHLAGAW